MRLLAFAGLLACALFLQATLSAFQGLPRGRPLRVEVPRGSSVWAVARRLERSGVLREGWTLVWLSRLLGRSHRVRAGRYALRADSSAWEVLRALTRGASLGQRVTVPEGYNLFQIADLLAARGVVRRDRFLRLATDARFAALHGVPRPSFEGFLFPDTYLLSRGMSEEDVILLMWHRFQEVYARYAPRARQVGLDVGQVVTLASLVEAEAMRSEEKPIIAAVFLSRLRLGMRLESDPTVRYALRKFRGSLTRRDLATPSPYNTYRVWGLPPTPICCPGEESIRAVLWPAKVDYLFFVSRNDGTHHFSRTYREHLWAVRRYQRGIKVRRTATSR